jgi:hypothetical protein
MADKPFRQPNVPAQAAGTFLDTLRSGLINRKFIRGGGATRHV